MVSNKKINGSRIPLARVLDTFFKSPAGLDGKFPKQKPINLNKI